MVDVDEKKRIVRVNLSGDIYVEKATILREQLIPYLERGYKEFIFDLDSATYIDSSGLGVLVAIHKRALTQGGSVKIRGLKGKIKELFELTLLTKVFTIV